MIYVRLHCHNSNTWNLVDNKPGGDVVAMVLLVEWLMFTQSVIVDSEACDIRHAWVTHGELVSVNSMEI